MNSIVINREVRLELSNATLMPISDPHAIPLKLDYLESLVLRLLIENSNNLVTYDTFLTHWRSTEATHNSLTRVVSSLRSKLRGAGLSNNVIVNTAKKGYTFTSHIEEYKEVAKQHIEDQIVLEDTNESIDKDQTLDTSLIAKVVLTVIFSLLIALVFVFSVTYFTTKPTSFDFQNAMTTEVLANSDIKIELAYNSSNGLIAYTTKRFDEDNWQVAIFDQEAKQKRLISNKYKNINKPAWISANELMYRESDENSCELRKATIEKGEITNSIKIFPCNSGSYSSSISLFHHDKVLFSDAELNDTASSIFLGDLTTGKVEKIEKEHGGGIGFYNIIASPDSELVAMLSSTDGISHKIELVDASDNWRSVWEISLKVTNFSVGWDGKTLSFLNNRRGITFVSFKGSNEVARNSVPTFSPIKSIVSTGQGLVMTSGELVGQGLFYADIYTGESASFTTGSNAKNNFGQLYNRDEILYISNRGGIKQVWSFNTATKKNTQLSAFDEEKSINSLTVEDEVQKLAIQVEDKIEVYRIEHNKIVGPIYSTKGYNPTIYKNNLIYSKYDGESSHLFSQNFSSFEEKKLIVKGGFISKANDSDLFYSKLYFPGVWRYHPDKEDELILSLSSNSYRWLVDENYIYFQNDQGSLFSYNIESEIKSKVEFQNCTQPVDIDKGKCVSRIHEPSINRIILLD